jgi:NitT/TauT family transport system ATP-binding protein
VVLRSERCPARRIVQTLKVSEKVPEPLLEISHLNKVYGVPGKGFEAIRDISVTVDDGQLICVVGPSGAGKTTLLKCIAGLLPITSGKVVLAGKSVTKPPPGLAVVFQEYGRSLFNWMTVRGNVELPLKKKGISKSERNQLIEDALEAVGLTEAAQKYPWQLSGGMQQRVAIARAIAYRPKVLLMDEPFAAVDAQTRADLEDLILEIWHKYGMTILFITHDIDESVYLGQRVVVLSNSPTTVQEDLVIDLPAERDQITTRSSARFNELRNHVWKEIQAAKGRSADTHPVAGDSAS